MGKGNCMAFEVPGLATQEVIPNRILLNDADCVAYWAAAGCDDMTRDAAYRRCDDRIAVILDQTQAAHQRHYLTGRGNFREKVATYQMYKGNRYDKHGNRIKPQPKWLQAVRQYLMDKYDAVLCEGQEADDALAIAQVKCNASQGYESIISSIDKDLKIVVGLHHDQNSGYIELVTELGYLKFDGKNKLRGAGLKFFYAQMLMGDSADWIPGLPKVTPEMKEAFDGVTRLGGCGPKAAFGVLDGAEDAGECLRRVLDCYASYWNGSRSYINWRTGDEVYPCPVDMVREQGQLLWMRHVEDQMWEPNPEVVLQWRKERGC